jgi:hypothetical protein
MICGIEHCNPSVDAARKAKVAMLVPAGTGRKIPIPEAS